VEKQFARRLDELVLVEIHSPMRCEWGCQTAFGWVEVGMNNPRSVARALDDWTTRGAVRLLVGTPQHPSGPLCTL